MKKFNKTIFAIFIFAVIAILLPLKTHNVYAREVSASQSITSDTEILDETIIIDTQGTAFTITNNAILTIRNCKITCNDEDIDVTTFGILFDVKSGSKLILDNVTIENIRATTAITNSGIVEIYNNTKIPSTITNSIINNSTKDNSLVIQSGDIPNITLNSGYISVLENTKIENNISLRINTHICHGKLIVRGIGDNVFANKHLDKFIYKNPEQFDENRDYFLDYIGDTTTATSDLEETLKAGDIVLSARTLYFRNSSTYFSGMYCTANQFISELIENEDYSLYSHATYGALNNHTANTETNKTYTKTESGLVTITPKINGNSINGQEDIKMIAGSSVAMFIDIPNNCELSNIEYIIDGTQNDTILEIEEQFANEHYMRPIVKYKSSELANHSAVINFIFTEKTKPATVNITKSDEVSVSHTGELIEGNTVTFTITHSNKVKVTSIYFNDAEITTELNNGAYLFTIELAENNSLVINTLNLPIEVSVAPTQNYSFEYGKDIIMIEEVLVDSTNEKIEVQFLGENTNAGTHRITGVVVLEQYQNEYTATLASGEYTYTITRKKVNVSEIKLKTYQTQYAESIELNANMFIDEIPEYFGTYTPQKIEDYKIGEQQIIIDVFIKYDSNYELDSNSSTRIFATLILTPITLDTSKYSLPMNFYPVYDGTEKIIPITNADEKIDVTYLFYTDKSTKTPVTPINVGIYYVEATLISTNAFYSTDTVLEGVFSISPREIFINLSPSSIEYTGYPYIPTTAIADNLVQGQNIEISLKEVSCINAGDYEIEILGINSNNYFYKNSTLKFTITPAQVDTSTLIFDDITTIYDGQNHKPILSGTLPLEISYKIDDTECKKAGTYTINCIFFSNTPNIQAPATISAKVTIQKKEIQAVFVPPELFIQGMSEDSIKINFLHTVNHESPNYTLEFLGSIQSAGTCTCIVKLSESSNYKLVGNTSFDLLVHANKASFKDENINISLEGVFLPSVDLTMTKSQNQNVIADTLTDIDYTSFVCFDINFKDYTTQRVKANVISSSVTNDPTNLRIFSYNNGILKEIEFTTQGNRIVFEMSDFGSLIFVQETSYIEKFQTPITIIVIASVLSLLTLLTFAINFAKYKKKLI